MSHRSCNIETANPRFIHVLCMSDHRRKRNGGSHGAGTLACLLEAQHCLGKLVRGLCVQSLARFLDQISETPSDGEHVITE